jgi:hypothetical protein
MDTFGHSSMLACKSLTKKSQKAGNSTKKTARKARPSFMNTFLPKLKINS